MPKPNFPKVSVIVPVYNVAQYLSKCLDSILSQTLQNIEVLVVNDGSPDNSQAIIDKYAQKDPRIISLSKKNGGLSDARNYALDRIQGEYVAFIDSDDYIDENMLEEMVVAAEKNKAQMVLCDLVKVNEKGEEFRDLPQSPQLPEKIVLTKGMTLFGEMSCFACNKLFKSGLFKEKRFKKGIHFEDIELIPQLLLECEIVAKVNKPFYKYFERQDSITKTHTAKGLDMFTAIDTVTKVFKESKYNAFKEDLKRFQIIQGFYSYLAYVAYVKDKKLKKEMLLQLKSKLKEYGIQKQEIKKYKRFNENYLQSLPLKKKMYYKAGLQNLNWLAYF